MFLLPRISLCLQQYLSRRIAQLFQTSFLLSGLVPMYIYPRSMNEGSCVLGKYREVTDKDGKKICMANCVDQTFRVTSSLNQYPGEESYNHRKDFCIIVRKLFKLTCPEKSMKKALEKRYPGLCDDVNDVMNSKGCEETWNKKGLGDDSARIDKFEENMFRYMKENIALLNIYLKQPYCEWILQDRLMKISQFISNMGGILGLALGASLISMLEVIWYCFLCAFKVFRK